WLPEDRPLYGRILLADDEPGVRYVCRAMLEAEGLVVVETEDGQEAVERYRDEGGTFDAVILDITMPRMDGYKALEAIREMNPGARVVLTTGNLQDAEEVQEVWGVPLLAKPYGSQELRAMVAGVLGRRSVTYPG
ncbi:MAG TPA: response regulator, partial [Longimicrobiales bacterium]|nr:response regulator [Longimicrobiales bacterium]